MRVQKKVLFLSVFLMIVGFATASTTLYLNGTIGIGTNEPDFDVYFSKAIENGVENNTLIQDKRHLSFRTELSKINEKYVLEYDVTNASKQYDVSIIINCTGGNEYLRVENKFNVVEDLKARSTRSGRLILTVIKSVFEETEVNITCEITGKARERIEVDGDEIEKEQVDYLKDAEYSSSATTYLGHELDKSKVESITLKDTKEVPEGVEFWDVSNSGNGSILAYTLDEDSDNMLELYIGQNGGVNANPNSSDLFYSFTNITSINRLEYLDTSNVTDMGRMFADCSSLTSLEVSKFNTSNLTDMSQMFYGCSKLTSIDVSRFDTSKVTNMSLIFDGCSNLTSIEVISFDTSKVTSMYSMFLNCSSLTSLNVSKFNTSSVTNMSQMFYGCSSLTNLDVSGFDTSKVTSMSSMFCGCSNLTSIDVSGFDTSKVTSMSSMFQSCQVKNINVKNFNTSKVTSMVRMFGYCSNLMSLDVSNFDMSNVTTMEAMFSGCRNLTSLDVSKFNTSSVTNMSQMFYGCSSLTNLDVSGFDTSKVTNMSSMFSKCSNLTNLDLSSFVTNNVTNMSYMFNGCSSLTNLDVSGFNTSNVTSMGSMFNGCSSLTNLDVSGFNTSKVTSMYAMFYNCSKLTTTITIQGTKCTDYALMFEFAATEDNAQITANYTEDASDFVDQMIATKSSNSNVIKGTVVA